VAIARSILLLPHQGIDSCCVIDIAHEPGTDIGTARILGGCLNPPAGEVRKIGSGICGEHIDQLDREGAFILE
jgi:hypothetical protein